MSDLEKWLSLFVATDLTAVPVAAAIGGTAIYLFLKWVGERWDIPSIDKFWLSMALAFIFPMGTYLLLVKLSPILELQANGVFLALAVGWMISQGIHKVDTQLSEPTATN